MSTFLPRKQLNPDFARMALLSGDDYSTELSKLDSLINFSRASAGTRFNASGVLESVASGQPRFDFDPATLLPRGLLIEEQRTNYFLQSQNFGASPWVAQGSPSRTAGADTSIGVPLDLVTGAGYGDGYYQLFPSSTLPNGTVIISFFFRKGTTAQSKIEFYQNGLGDIGVLTITWNGNVPSFTYSAGAMNLGAPVQINANVWRGSFGVPSVVGSATNGIYTYPSNGASANIYWGGFQVEAGVSVTSYISTTTATVTRAADVASITSLAPWFNAASGTWAAEADTANPIGSARAFILSSNGATMLPGLEWDSDSGYARVEWYDGTHDFILYSAGVWSTTRKIATSYAAAGISFSALGEAIQTHANTMTAAPTSFYLGCYNGSSLFLNGHLKRLAYLPWQVSSGLLRALST